MGGDLKKIRVVGEYMIEVWKAVGMNLDMVDFLWASDEINARPAEYWSLVMDVAIKFKLARIMRCTQQTGLRHVVRGVPGRRWVRKQQLWRQGHACISAVAAPATLAPP